MRILNSIVNQIQDNPDLSSPEKRDEFIKAHPQIKIKEVTIRNKKVKYIDLIKYYFGSDICINDYDEPPMNIYTALIERCIVNGNAHEVTVDKDYKVHILHYFDKNILEEKVSNVLMEKVSIKEMLPFWISTDIFYESEVSIIIGFNNKEIKDKKNPNSKVEYEYHLRIHTFEPLQDEFNKIEKKILILAIDHLIKKNPNELLACINIYSKNEDFMNFIKSSFKNDSKISKYVQYKFK